MADAKGIIQVLEDLMKGGSKGLPNMDDALGNLSKIFDGMSVTSKELFSQLTTLQTSIKSGNIIGVMQSIDSMAKELDINITSMASSIFTILDNTIASVIGLGTQSLARTQRAMGGLSAAVNEFGSVIKDTMNAAARETGIKSLGAVGTMTSQIISTAMSAFSIFFQDRLAKQQMRYLAEAQTGGGREGAERGAAAVETMRSLYGNFSREEAKSWSEAILKQGAPLEKDLSDRMIRVGMSMGLGAGDMGAVLDRFLVLTTQGQDAGEIMADSFRAAREAAEQSGIPVQKLQKFMMDAAVNARYLNVDMGTVASTMQMMTENQEKFRAAGVSIREDGGKILDDLTGGSKKFSDSMFAFFGTKGGTEGSPIEGLIKAKFGTTFASSLQSTAGGGFTAQGGTSGDMMAQRLDVMKQTMMDASRGASSDAEKLYIQQKLAQDTFGMSEETARVLAMSSKEDLAKVADNPKLADQFKSQKDILSDLKSMEAINQNVQRGMAGLAAAQLKNMIAVATNTAVTAAEAAGVDVSDLGIKGEILRSVAGTFESSKETLEFAAKLTKGVVKGAGAEKEMTDLTTIISRLKSVAGGKQTGGQVYAEHAGSLLTGGKQTGGQVYAEHAGGQVYAAQTGKNVYSVAEDGRPEMFHGGSGSNILFSPGEAGKIFNASETMGVFNKGLGGGGEGEGAAAPTVSKTGSGEQTVLNITINAGTLDKGSFAKLLETEILDHIYR